MVFEIIRVSVFESGGRHGSEEDTVCTYVCFALGTLCLRSTLPPTAPDDGTHDKRARTKGGSGQLSPCSGLRS